MKAKDLRCWLGANHSDSQSYREDAQQRQQRKDEFSCFVISGVDYLPHLYRDGLPSRLRDTYHAPALQQVKPCPNS